MRRIDIIICRAALAAPFHLLSVPTAFASAGSLAYRGCPACGSATGPYAYAITVTGNAPEPMTLAPVGIGIAGFGFTRRKRSNSSCQAA